MSTQVLQLKTLKYWAIAKASYRHANAYTGDVISLALLAACRLWVLMQLYTVAYQTSSASIIAGFTLPMTLWSLMVTNSLQLSFGSRGVLQPLSEDIQTGNIAYILNRPFSFLAYLFFNNWGRLFARSIPTLFVSVLVTWILVGPISTSGQAVAASIVLGILGLSMNLIFLFCIGLLGFWVEEVKPYRWVFDRMQWVIGGIVIPLSFFPESWGKIVELLPFAQTYYAAARILVAYDQKVFLLYLVAQIFWLIVGMLIVVMLYKKGIKNISINGG